MKETSKATERRKEEGGIWNSVFIGKGIDVGSGDDPLVWGGTEIKTFDIEDGDANVIADYFEPESFDFLHASQCLEHMHNPYEALDNWSKVVKVGGHLVVTIPDFVLYEKLNFPSIWNPDHKSTWSSFVKGSWAPYHVYIPQLVERLEKSWGKVKIARLVDRNYDYYLGTHVDQTFDFEDRVECFQELVIEKVKSI
jgi:SAM-dependent methyltransferase